MYVYAYTVDIAVKPFSCNPGREKGGIYSCLYVYYVCLCLV